VSQRKPRILWANVYCMLDTSSGASMAVREMLRQLVLRGFEVGIVGATVFDVERGIYRLKEHWDEIKNKKGQFINVNDGPLKHQLLITANTARDAMTSREEGLWHGYYVRTLDQFKPDLVFYYGGQALDYLIAQEARSRQIPVAFCLVNGNYSGSRWCQDVDLIITDSQATASMYAQKEGYKIVPVGAFINPGPVLAQKHSRKRVLMINPRPEKGAAVVIALAVLLEKRRPDIVFEVVESRGKWDDLVKMVTSSLGEARDSLDNVVVTPNTDDMRPIYGRARMLLAPSLWWESGGRVSAEAMMNGIPAIVTDRGGMPEMIQDGGIKVRFPEACYQAPYLQIPEQEHLAPMVDIIIRMYDDPAFYDNYAQRALKVGRTLHSLQTSTQRLLAAFAPLLQKRAGDQDFVALQKQLHKQGLAPASQASEGPF